MVAFGLVTCLVLSQSSAKFFPIDNRKGISNFEEARYGKSLRALEEPIKGDLLHKASVEIRKKE